MKIRASFPQVYQYFDSKTDNPYFLVSARSRKWGMNERKTFSTEKGALDHARKIAELIEKRGAQPQITKEKAAMADAYLTLADKLKPHGKTPEDAVEYYIKFLGNEIIRQALPSISELAEKGLNETQSFERLQMRCFLHSVAKCWEFGFPVQVYHTSDRNPDFVIQTPNQRIGVECSRITNEKIGRLNKLDLKGKIGSAFSPTPFLISTGRMKTTDLLTAATGNSQFFPPKWGDVREEFLFWIQCADSVLADKTEAMDKPNYQPCDQYWLLLRDEMTGDRHEMSERARIVHEGLQQTWLGHQKWFSRVVIQDESLDWHVTITQAGITPSPTVPAPSTG